MSYSQHDRLQSQVSVSCGQTSQRWPCQKVRGVLLEVLWRCRIKLTRALSLLLQRAQRDRAAPKCECKKRQLCLWTIARLRARPFSTRSLDCNTYYQQFNSTHNPLHRTSKQETRGQTCAPTIARESSFTHNDASLNFPRAHARGIKIMVDTRSGFGVEGQQAPQWSVALLLAAFLAFSVVWDALLGSLERRLQAKGRAGLLRVRGWRRVGCACVRGGARGGGGVLCARCVGTPYTAHKKNKKTHSGAAQPEERAARLRRALAAAHLCHRADHAHLRAQLRRAGGGGSASW